MYRYVFLGCILLNGTCCTVMNKTIVTMYLGQNNLLTWYDAKYYCASRGGQLLKLENLDKWLAVKGAMINEGINISVDEDIWIGLGNPTSSDECTDYYWTDGNRLGAWTNWETQTDEPDDCRHSRCIRIGPEAWRTRNCNRQYNYACENIGECTLDVQRDTDFTYSPANKTLLTVHAPLDVCRTICLRAYVHGLPCWDVKFKQDGEACVLLFAESVNILTMYHTMHSSQGTTHYVKTCLTVKSSTTESDIFDEPDKPAATTHGGTIETSTPAPICPTGGSVGDETVTVQHTTTSNYSSTTPLSKAEMKKKLAHLVAETKIETNTTNARMRTKTSIRESRPSAVSMGLVASAILASVFGLMIISDFLVAMKYIWTICCNLKRYMKC